MSVYELIPLMAQGAEGTGTGGSDPLGAISAGMLVIALVSLWLVKKAGLVGIAVWFEATYPMMNARILRLTRQRPWKCGLLGLLNVFIGALLVLFLLATRVLGLLGIALFLCIMAIGLMGYAAAYLGIGRRIAGEDATVSGPRAVLLGGVTAEAAFMFPFVGQLAALAVFFRGFGAACLALLEARRERKQAAGRPAEQAAETTESP